MKRGCPMIIRLDGKLCVIIGGGRGAAVKARAFLRAGARIRIVAEDISEELSEELNGTDTEYIRRGYAAGDTDGAFIVFALTGDAKTDAEVRAEARRGGALVGGDDIVLPACAEGENITAFVSTGYPKLSARLMRHMLRFDSACGMLAEFRSRINASGAPPETRAETLDAAVTDDMLKLALESGTEYKQALDALYDTKKDTV